MPLHLHIISMHTSPLAQPGSGDAGGMNVYIDRSLRSLLKRYPQLSVEVFTLATEATGRISRRIEIDAGRRALVHFIDVGKCGLRKEDLPAYVPVFARGVREKMRQRPDLVHAHYWLSGLVALEYAPGVPLIETFHTTALAKNLKAGAGEAEEPALRVAGEQRLVSHAQKIVVNTEFEADQMRELYGAASSQLEIITPGVEPSIFRPLAEQQAAHRGSSTRAHLLFTGRPQPLKGPHIVVEAMTMLPADLQVSFEISGESGSDYETKLMARAQELGLDVTLSPALSPHQLAEKFRRADIVVCPSSSETFGLVALEAQAAGACLLASDVDGLRSAVQKDYSGVLVAERTPEAWAKELEALIRNPERREALGAAASDRARGMTWDDTAEALMKLYQELAATRKENTL